MHALAAYLYSENYFRPSCTGVSLTLSVKSQFVSDILYNCKSNVSGNTLVFIFAICIFYSLPRLYLFGGRLFQIFVPGNGPRYLL